MHRFRFSRLAIRAVPGLVALAAVTGLMFPSSVLSQTAPQAASGTTPRLPDGKPDLSGMWNGTAAGGGGGNRFTNVEEQDGDLTRLFPSRRCAPNQQGCRDNTNQSNDGELTGRTETNKPIYKPEHWDRVQFLDYDTNFSDPMFRCDPLGIPRIGPPTKIVQMPGELLFLYNASRNSNGFHYRIIPMDGRKHNPDAFPSFYGDSIGYWDGDTLVIEVVNFTDTTWLSARGGYFHSFDLRVIERFRREGDVLHYSVTIEDPTVLLQPWLLQPRQLRLNRDANATLDEGLPCREYDSEITVSRIRH